MRLAFSLLAGALLASALLATGLRAPAIADPARMADFDRVSDDVIPWRGLVVEDFRAAGPPLTLQHAGTALNAVSCVFVGTDGEIALDITQEVVHAGRTRYRVRTGGIRIVSLFDRACSWWNPSVSPERVAYTLEHEQIHFALAELAARRLQRLLDARREELESAADSVESARDRVQMQLDIALRSVAEELGEEHRRFDDETSHQHDPVAQRRWRADVEERLGAKLPLLTDD